MTKIVRLAFFLLLVTVINCAHVCKEDGQFENSEDRTSYYDCTDGKSHFRRCPEAADGLSYLVFNGKECVESHPAFVCPQESGNYRYINNDKQYYECVKNKPILRNCHDDSKFDGLKCVDLEAKHQAKTEAHTEIEPQVNTEAINETNTEVNNTEAKIEGKLEEPEDEEDFICPSSTGVYPNPDDRHSYYECKEDEPRLKLCPREKTVHLHGAHGKHRRRMIWDGHQCIQVHRNSDNRNSRQAPVAPDYMFTCPMPEGRFADPRDQHYFFRCENNKIHQEVCPGYTIFSESRGGCVHLHNRIRAMPSIALIPVNPVRRQVFEDLRGDACPSGYEYDPASGRCRREDIVDPIVVSGPAVVRPGEPQCPADSTYDIRSGQCRSERYVEPIRTAVVQPQVTTTCPEGFTYNANSGRCFREVLTSPIINNAVQPQVSTRCPSGYTYDIARDLCIRETIVDPIVTQPVTTCGAGFSYNTALRTCEPVNRGRYRRNGRVETEDRINGAVIVDTWNEGQWRWDRNPNGNRILPDVNGWLDRSLAYAHARNSRGNDQHERGRSMQ